MPSPFPGMDPYLELPARWTVLHARLVPYLADVINPMLPDRYVANPTERVYVIEDDRSIYPDVVVAKLREQRSSPLQTATAASDPPQVLTVEPLEIREPFIEIVSIAQPGRVIATIEILSPHYKASAQQGGELYVRKQNELLRSSAHLLEIDLLRQGQHTIAAPRHALERFSPWHYMICLHRAGAERRFEVWPVKLQDRLPRIHVPLDEGDEPVVVDLQSLLDHCYDAGAFSRQVDYRAPVPPPSLNAADAEWVDSLLRERGLR
jgi:Protein of unknown function (DUF4058)